ncbi:T9SS type A sorting domain-containing protein [uncultured Winogradskyella sp.]|uniref:T9SS type A sorting domain-containing protein n=1 Tax=uncultured Winogradskyella sp. TaxID=395353 RepID=UPI002627E10B|nr:T9SS type A sorting domain-containing protein [uncultured Winogradskyella sp.]
MKFSIKNFLAFLVLLISNITYCQVNLTADGVGNTYELINNVLAYGYTSVETPDCGHSEYGRHIEEVWDTDLEKYVFKFTMHLSPDNDRCINFNRQRVEIKTYSPSPENLKGTINETITYKWKFKLANNFQPSYNFTHIHHIKSVGGDDALPLFTLTPRKGSPNKLELIYIKDEFSGIDKKAIVDLSNFEGEWVEVVEKIKVGEHGFYSIVIEKVSDGNILLSYNNADISTIRADNNFIRPKWGIYRGLNTPADLRDESVLFADFSITEAPRKIFLKLDDVVVNDHSAMASSTLNYLRNNDIKASFGLVADRNDASTLSVWSEYLNEKDDNGNRLFEIWNHGFDHLNPEFDGTSYAYQKAHFESADSIMNNLLRLRMHTFGAPFNHNDAITNLVISENPNYKVTFFNNPAPDPTIGIINLTNRVNMENGTGNPQYNFFVSNYNTYKNTYIDYMVLQGHPNVWDSNDLIEFQNIINFLISEGCEFILPYDYYLELHPDVSQPNLSQNIVFPDIPLKALNDLDFSPEAMASSGLDVLYNSSNPEVAIIQNGEIHIENVGSSIITASQMGNGTYKTANYVSRVLNVEEGSLSNTDIIEKERIVSYFPNPTDSNLLIKSSIPILSVKVYNLLGQKLLISNFNDTNVKVDLRILPQSIYQIVIETIRGKEIFKIIKE